MSVNCIRCMVNRRTGPDLLCDRCRNPVNKCRACGGELLPEDSGVADGCPCNAPRGINHGLVPKHVCTCDKCDPEQTGSTRKPSLYHRKALL